MGAAVICYKPYLGLLGMICMLPLEPILTFSASFTAIKAVGLITFLSFAFHCLLRKERIEIDLRVFLPLIVFLIWAAVGVDGNYFTLFKLTQLILFFVMTIALCFSNNRRINLIIWAYIIGCLIAVCMASFGYLSNTAFNVRASLETQDANKYAIIIGLGLLLLLFLKPRFKKYKMLIPYGMAIPFIYGLIISASRGAVVALALSLFVYLIVNRNRLKSAANILIICLIVGTVFVVGLQKGLINEFSVNRIESTKSYEDTTLAGRFFIWGVGWEMIKDNFLTGVGLGNFPSSFNKYAGRSWGTEWGPHNTFLSIFAETGFIGFLILLWFIVTLSYMVMKTENENKVFVLCILVFIATVSSSITTHFTKVFWFSIALAYLLLNYTEQDARPGDGSGFRPPKKHGAKLGPSHNNI